MTRDNASTAPSSEERLIPVDDVAAILAVSRRTVFRWSDVGKMPPPLRIGGSIRWRLTDVRRWIADGCPTIKPQESQQ